MMKFRILGPVEAVHAGSPLPLGGPRHRRLLATLLLHAGDVVPTGTLILALWGDSPPRSAQAMVHVRVSELRAALRTASAELVTRDGGYVLEVGRDDLDAWRFERLAAAGAAALAAGDPERARADLTAGLTLWRGPALAEFADEPFLRAAATRLERLRLQAIEDRIAADLDLGRHGEVVAELETLAAEHPLRERFSGQLMLALYRAGRQGEALQAYQTARELIAEQLGLDPGGDLQRLQAAILRQDPKLDIPAASPARRRGNLPVLLTSLVGRRRGNLPVPLTSFVGRRRDLAETHALLGNHRLVTLTGVGGVGKSRLAVEAAEAAAASQSDLPDGIWLVDLAALARPGLVAPAIAATLGVAEDPRRPLVEVLADQLGAAQTLLVLDNCEHLIDGVVDVTGPLLHSCPGLRILATSRERLGITGEAVWPVAGLDVPAPDTAGVDAIGRADAVQLIVDRANSTRPGFHLTEATAATVAEICRRLDGLPLALELAATGIQVWGVEQIAARLNDPYGLLTRGSRTAPPRHRTLRAAMDWSYSLLDPAQRRLFGRLAVFVGGFTVRAAEAICGDTVNHDPPVADVLAGLVDKSLVTVDHTDAAEPRYRMLETVRRYAFERLEKSGTAVSAIVCTAGSAH